MKIYTRTGDQGQTGLFGDERVPKDNARICAVGTVDELNAALGLARTANTDESIDALLLRIQNELFMLGADLATPKEHSYIVRMTDAYVARMEEEIDAFEPELEALRYFILPGGTPIAAHLHLARTICRRAERETVHLAAKDDRVNPVVMNYLNRLSDWLFTLARVANRRAGVPDVPWYKPE